MVNSLNVITEGILELIRQKDNSLYEHSINVSRLATAMAREIGMDKDNIELIKLAGRLHDIGKISIPESITHKNGAFVDSEYEVMKNHPVYSALYVLASSGIKPQSAHELIAKITTGNGSSNREAICAAYGVNDRRVCSLIFAVMFHHEKHDGSGYPAGLKGGAIPINAAILCLVDYFVAMCEKRPYRDGYDMDCVLETIKKYSGGIFSSSLVDKLLPHLHRHAIYIAGSLQRSSLMIDWESQASVNINKQVNAMFMKVIDKKLTREDGAIFLKHLLEKNEEDEVLNCLTGMYKKLPVGLYPTTFLHVIELTKNPFLMKLIENAEEPKKQNLSPERGDGGYVCPAAK